MSHGLFPAAPDTPDGWCERWAIPLLPEIPYPGLCTAKDLEGMVPDKKRWPGRNDPRAGAWLYARYGGGDFRCADPMYGVGQLWLKVPTRNLVAVELEPSLVDSWVQRADARTWQPINRQDLVMFSPPFLQNHSAGATAHQHEIRDRKGLHAMQAFGVSDGNLGSMRADEFWRAMLDVYCCVYEYTKISGHMVVILRNLIRQGLEVDIVGQHVSLMRNHGWSILGAHPRALRPTGYQQWKVARNASTPWIKTEWAVVAMPGSL